MDIEKCNCYYEILNIKNDATIDEIKKSYKKIILQYHPDKNAHLSEEEQKKYTNIFRKIQEAYECLIDERRRKWYDKNRKRIVEGREEEEKNELNKYSSKNINIWEYFNNSCFNGFDDSEKGFYTVYKKLFDEIIKEENEEIQKNYKNNKEKINAPSFGNSKSCGKEIDAFYEFWSNFTTVKKFDYSYDYIKSCEFENRNIRRTLKKVSEKRSLKERKEYNENIRSLVHYLKKHDVRYLNRMVEIAEEKRKKIEEREKQKKLQMLQRKILFEQNKKKEFLESEDESNNYSHHLEDKDVSDSSSSNSMRKVKKCTEKEEKRKHNANNFKNKEDDVKREEENYFNEEINANYEGTDNSEVNRDTYNNYIDEHNEFKKIIYRCEVCKKDFKSMKQYESHEKSKKHISNFLKNSKKYDLRNIFEEEKKEEKDMYSEKKIEKEDNIDNEKKEFSNSSFANKEKINNNINKKFDNSSASLNVGKEKLKSNENLSSEGALEEDNDKIFQDKNNTFKYKSKENKRLKESYDRVLSETERKEEKEDYDEEEEKKKQPNLKKKKKKKSANKGISCNKQNDVSSSESSHISDDLLSWYRTTKKKKNFIPLESSIEVDDYLQNGQTMNDSNDDYKTLKLKKKALKKNKKKASIQNENKLNNLIEENSDMKPKVNNHFNHKLKENIRNIQCKICKQTFDSRNKLFQHIEIKGHAATKNNDNAIKINKNKRNN